MDSSILQGITKITGSLQVYVNDASAFANDPSVARAMRSALAAEFGLSEDAVKIIITEVQRRLSANLRSGYQSLSHSLSRHLQEMPSVLVHYELMFSDSSEQESNLEFVAASLVTVRDDETTRSDLETVLQNSVNSVAGNDRFVVKLVGATSPTFHKGEASSTRTSTSSPSLHVPQQQKEEQWEATPVDIAVIVLSVVTFCCCLLVCGVPLCRKRGADRMRNEPETLGPQSRAVTKVVDASLKLNAVDKAKMREVSTQDDIDYAAFSGCADDNVAVERVRQNNLAEGPVIAI